MLAAHANRVTILDRDAKALKKLEGMSASSVCASSRSNPASRKRKAEPLDENSAGSE